jgi:hypothetical protein
MLQMRKIRKPEKQESHNRVKQLHQRFSWRKLLLRILPRILLRLILPLILYQVTMPLDSRLKVLRACAHTNAKISHIDSWIGRILETLKQRGLLDNTYIISWSDHGEMLGDKGRVYKWVFYEESVHVPLIIRPPRSAHAGTVYNGLTTLDVYPTLLDLAGSSAQYRGFGHSLLPILDDPQRANHQEVYSEIDFRTMVFDGRYKLVIDNASAALLKLYDLQQEPDEAINLVGHEGVEETVKHLKERLLAWLLRTQLRKPVEPGKGSDKHARARELLGG